MEKMLLLLEVECQLLLPKYGGVSCMQCQRPTEEKSGVLVADAIFGN